MSECHSWIRRCTSYCCSRENFPLFGEISKLSQLSLFLYCLAWHSTMTTPISGFCFSVLKIFRLAVELWQLWINFAESAKCKILKGSAIYIAKNRRVINGCILWSKFPLEIFQHFHGKLFQFFYEQLFIISASNASKSARDIIQNFHIKFFAIFAGNSYKFSRKTLWNIHMNLFGISDKDSTGNPQENFEFSRGIVKNVEEILWSSTRSCSEFPRNIFRKFLKIFLEFAIRILFNF